MLTAETINSRLLEMKQKSDDRMSLWPENCEGSRNALVVFVGPSPGGKKEKERKPIKINQNKPYWNSCYRRPLDWSSGFKRNFQTIVEKIFHSGIRRSRKTNSENEYGLGKKSSFI